MSDIFKIIYKYKNVNRKIKYEYTVFFGVIDDEIMKINEKIKDYN
jgi:hypothetical protein